MSDVIDLRARAADLGIEDTDLATTEELEHAVQRAESSVATLDDVEDFILRFIAFPDRHCAVALALWAAHTHIIDNFYTTPRVAIISPELGSGKTRVLEILALLVNAPMFAFNASPPTIYRRLKDQKITLLFDEVDTVFRQSSKEDDHADLRALLNAGYKRGAVVPRCVGPQHEVVDFDVFCPVALAGIGELPDTIMSRSVVIKMRRRAPHETVEPYRNRINDAEGQALAERLADWTATIGEVAGADYPELPPGIVDRPAEVWEPLVAIADQAGGRWPLLAREAAVELCKAAEDRRMSLGIRLLADMRIIFGADDKLATTCVVDRLIKGEGLADDAPWSDLRGKPLTSRTVASLLRPYGIKSKNVAIGTARPKGYAAADLHDAWQRYLPPPLGKSATSATSATSHNGAGYVVADCGEVADRNATLNLSATEKPHTYAEVAANPGACPACGGEGCRHCGDTARNPEAL